MQGGRRRGIRQKPLKVVEVAQLLHALHCLSKRHWLIATKLLRVSPTHLWEHLLQVGGKLRHVLAQLIVTEHLGRKFLQLGALLGRHRVENGLGGCHAFGDERK